MVNDTRYSYSMITYKAKTPDGEIIKSALSHMTFPAGEAHIKKEPQRELEKVEIAIIQPDADSLHDDLFQLAMWNDYIINMDTTIKTVAVIPYFPGARADRGVPFGLKVYADFINSLVINQIIIFDPHSQKTPELVRAWENLTIVYSDELFNKLHMRPILNQYTGIIAPDKGALLRAQAVADIAGLPVFTATKERDEETGKLSKFTIEGLDPDGVYLIVDDICDGGGTFIGLVEASGLEYGSFDLYVSHGVFSKEALFNLSMKFEYVYTTNSYAPERELVVPENNHKQFHRFDVIRLLLEKI